MSDESNASVFDSDDEEICSPVSPEDSRPSSSAFQKLIRSVLITVP